MSKTPDTSDVDTPHLKSLMSDAFEYSEPHVADELSDLVDDIIASAEGLLGGDLPPGPSRDRIEAILAGVRKLRGKVDRLHRSWTHGAPPKPVRRPQRTETLLIVETDAMVRDVLYAFLLKEGYKVQTACSAQEALTNAEKDGNRISLLITPQRLPEMDGGTLYRRITESAGPVKVLYLSSVHEETGRDPDPSPETGIVLQKPFPLRKLSEAVTSLLTP